jgi:tetratricopeptide (TPR) repeat protein/serine/threonine protein kinase
MPNPMTDRNLLFGILALQMDFIRRDALIVAMNAWVLEKSKPLGLILLEQNALTADTHALLEALVQKHLALHDNDAEKSLAAVSSVGSVRKDLEEIADGDVQASIVFLPSPPRGRGAGGEGNDPYATVSVGIPTSAGTRFHILRPHAKGGLGQVSVALDEELHREVALKEIQDRHADDKESRSRFMLEAEITGGLEHPGIVPVYGLGTYADGRPYYAMRFIRGDSLQDAIKHFHNPPPSPPGRGAGGEGKGARSEGERTLELRKLLGRFIDVCEAIQYAHDRGILHRDLKPGNIMLGKYGETLVVDWGLAKAVGRAESRERPRSTDDEPTLKVSSISGSAETLAGTAVGTPAFMSPEQAAGRLDLLGPASDVYSLGATLYTLLTGKPSMVDKDVGVVLAKVQRGDFPRPRQIKPDVHPALEAICLKAMALKSEDRYASPRVLADDLERWLGDEPVSALPEPMTVKVGRWMRRHKPLVSGVAAALLVGVIALSAGAIWYESQQAETARKEALAQAETDRKEALVLVETARKQAIADEKVRRGLEQARQTRAELHKVLKQPGGVQALLNQPARWQAQLKSARADWQRANDHAEAAVGPQWTNLLKTLDKELTRDQADYDLALRLEKIRLDRATVVKGNFNFALAQQEYPAAFAEAGLTPAPGRQKEVALLIRQSAIKDQLLAALDDWAYCEQLANNPELTRRLLEVARLTDPDPWRNKVRDPDLWSDEPAIVKLVQKAQTDGAFLARLSPQMLDEVSLMLPKGKTEETWLRTAQTLHPADFWINYRLAYLLAEKKDNLEAAGFYRVALAVRPNSAAVYNGLGNALRNQKDLPAAIDAYKKALAIDPKFELAWTNLGLALRDQKDLPAAIDACKKALAIDPENTRAYNSLGLALQDQKALPAAIDAYKKALAIDPQYVIAWHNLGSTLHDQKDLPAAIDAYEKALAIDPQYAPAWNNLGNALQDQKDLPKAINAYKKALAIDPQYKFAWLNLGNALQNQKDLPKAINAYKKALAIDPQYALAWYNLGHALQDQKDLPAAIDAYKKGLAIDPQDALAWTNLGVALQDQKDLPATIDAYKKALAINPKYAPAWYNLGNALQDQKDLPATIAAYKKALAIDPQYAPAWNNLGNALRNQKDLLAAIDAYKNALAIDPKYALAWHNLGYALQDQKDLPAAIAAYKNALAIDPKDARAWTNLGHALRNQNDLPAAIDAYKKALAADPKHVFAWSRLGNALQGQNDLPAAIDAYKKALTIDPKFAYAWNGLARAYNHHNDIPASMAAAEQAIRLGQGNSYTAACAAALAGSGRGQEIVKLNAEEKAMQRRKARDLLQEDLDLYGKPALEGQVLSLIQIVHRLPHWQKDSDLAGVRDPKELAKLPEDERKHWQKLWADVQEVLKNAQSRFRETRLDGTLTAKEKAKVHEIKMTAGTTYVLDMESLAVDTFLKLQDPEGKLLAENDDVSPDDLNSRIVFTASKDGDYRIEATSFEQRGTGAYTVTVREFATKKN